MSAADPELDALLHARAHTRAKELAELQCEPEEIVAALELELGWDDTVGYEVVAPAKPATPEAEPEPEQRHPITRARQWAIDHAPEITRWRFAARIAKRQIIDDIIEGRGKTSEMSSTRERLLTEWMRQHAGWAKQAPLDKLMEAFYAAAKDADRRARGGRKLRAA